MNSMVREDLPWVMEYQALRGQLLDALTDDDLAYTPGGDNPSLGALCREIGYVEAAYIESFETFTIDFEKSRSNQDAATSVDALRAWYEELDAALKAAVERLTDEDISQRMIDRGPGFQVPPSMHLHIYREALLIFYGKTDVYLRCMGRQVSEQWTGWIS